MSLARCDANLLLGAVTTLSAAVAFVAALHLYARCVLQRRVALAEAAGSGGTHAPRRPPHHGYEVEIVVVSAGGACGVQDAGLDAKALRALPVFMWGSKSHEEEAAAGGGDAVAEHEECAVCLGEMEDGELGRLLPACRHVFHVECIDTWLRVSSACPVCRTAAGEAASGREPEPGDALC